MTNLRGMVFAVSALALASAVHAGGIDLPLYSSGVGFSGASLSGGLLDSHYALSYNTSDGIYNDYATVIDPPNSRWLDYSAGNGDSRWIGRQNNSSASDAVGDYTFTTRFKATTTSVMGRWASDNQAVASIDGMQVSQIDSEDFVGSYSPSDPGRYSYGHWTKISLNNLLVGQIYTLEFVVHNAQQGDGSTNDGNPTGLRVDFQNAEATPEPFTMALMVGGAGLAIRKRMKK